VRYQTLVTRADTFILIRTAASVVTEEFHYDLVYSSAEAHQDVEPAVAIQLAQQHRDPVSGLVCLDFNVVFAPFKVMKYVYLPHLEFTI